MDGRELYFTQVLGFVLPGLVRVLGRWLNPAARYWLQLCRLIDEEYMSRPLYENWSTEVTHIRLAYRLAHLVAIIDWYSNKVLAWRISANLDASN